MSTLPKNLPTVLSPLLVGPPRRDPFWSVLRTPGNSVALEKPASFLCVEFTPRVGRKRPFATLVSTVFTPHLRRFQRYIPHTLYGGSTTLLCCTLLSGARGVAAGCVSGG